MLLDVRCHDFFSRDSSPQQWLIVIQMQFKKFTFLFQFKGKGVILIPTFCSDTFYSLNTKTMHAQVLDNISLSYCRRRRHKRCPTKTRQKVLNTVLVLGHPISLSQSGQGIWNVLYQISLCLQCWWMQPSAGEGLWKIITVLLLGQHE